MIFTYPIVSQADNHLTKLFSLNISYELYARAIVTDNGKPFFINYLLESQ